MSWFRRRSRAAPSMDSKERAEFNKFFQRLLEQDQGQSPVRIFEQKEGEYYTVFGDDAKNLAETFFHTKEVLRSQDSVPSVHIQARRLAGLLKMLLLESGKNVEMFTKNDSGVWSCSKQASPGNLQSMEDMLFSDSDAVDSSVIMAVQLHSSNDQIEIGVAMVDMDSRQIGVCQFLDTSVFSVLESIIVQHGAKECLVPNYLTSESNALRQVLDRCGVPCNERKKGEFTAHEIERKLEHLVGPVRQHLSEIEKEKSMEALYCLILYLGMGTEEGSPTFCMSEIDLAEFMRLDTAAMRALNLFPSANDANQFSSLFGLLKHCRTAAGSRLLRQWIKQPLMSLDQIRKRHDLVSCLVTDSVLCQFLHDDGLKRVPDLVRLNKRFQDGKAKLQDCVALYQFVLRLPSIVDTLKQYEGDSNTGDLFKSEFTDKLEKVSNDFSQFVQLIQQTVDLEAADRHHYVVNAGFDPNLQQLKDSKLDVEEQIEKLRLEIADDLGLADKSVKLNHKEGTGYHLRITRKEEKSIRKKCSIINLETRKDGVRFTTVAMRRLSRQYEDHAKKYEQIQDAIVQKLVSVVASYGPVMERCHNILTPLDVFVSFAHASMNAPEQYVRPEMLPLGTGRLELRGSRHPCLEVQDHVNSFIANNALFDENSRFHIISGPNMGGKSTYIRQIGVIVVMAQIGCFVPCSSAVISIVDCILARVGAGDCQLRGVSTFMAEMLEAAGIVKTATQNSLIIIDELGRGTSTYDGFGLAWAISEHIATEIKCNAVFATHFHELTELAQHCPQVVNQHVTATTASDTITMLYEVRDGPCDRSFGIHVAELAKFPACVVQMAKRKAEELESFGKSADESPEKRKRIELLAQRFKAMPIDMMNDDELLRNCEKLRAEIESVSV